VSALPLYSEDIYPFTSQSEKKQFARMTQETRCMTCQNQSIADSTAPFAADLRAAVYLQVKEHKTDAQIRAHLKQRFGDYVLLQPPLEKQTWPLWAAPLFLSLLGFGILFTIISRQPARSSVKPVEEA
jgi:cytochrome c-type biogenesis protein CcmH